MLPTEQIPDRRSQLTNRKIHVMLQTQSTSYNQLDVPIYNNWMVNCTHTENRHKIFVYQLELTEKFLPSQAKHRGEHVQLLWKEVKIDKGC